MGEKRKISLPYVISDSPLGEQQLQIQKDGYLPFNKTTLVSDARVFDVSVELIPDFKKWKDKIELSLSDDDIVFEGGLAHMDYSKKIIEVYFGSTDILAKKVSTQMALPSEVIKENFTSLTYLDRNYFLLQLGEIYYILSNDRVVPIKKDPFEKLFVFNHQIFMFDKNIGTLSILSFTTLEKKVVDTALLETNFTVRLILEESNIESKVYKKNDHYFYIDMVSGSVKMIETQIFEESPHEIFILDKNIFYKDSLGILRRKDNGDLLLSGIIGSFPLPGQMLFTTSSQKIYRLIDDRVEYVGDTLGKQIWSASLQVKGSFYLLQYYDGLSAFDTINAATYQLYPTKTPLDIKHSIIGPYLEIKDYAKNTRFIYILD